MKQKSLLDGEFSKQIEAADLIQNKGFSQKEAAEKVLVSERTMCEWMIKFNWNKPDPMEKKKKDAESLLSQNFSQKEVGLMIKVSQKTLCKWVKKYKWKAKYVTETPTINQVKFAVDNFLLYVDCNAPGLSKELRELSEKFYNEEPELLALIK